MNLINKAKVQSSFSSMEKHSATSITQLTQSQLAIKKNPTDEFGAPTSYLFSQVVNSVQ